MRIWQLVSLAACFLFVDSAAARAQDATKVGVTMAYPTSIGLIWPMSDKVAVRPEFTISGSSAESPTGLETSSWTIGTGVSVLFYLKDYDRVRTYFTPRFDYSRSSSSSDTGSASIPSIDLTRWASGGSGSFGVQYAPGEKFGVFGEVGFGFSYSSLPSLTEGSTGHATGWGMRSGVGVIFYP
jgi:hypothetical protein